MIPTIMSIELYEKTCKKCGNLRKFVRGTDRDKQDICGNCWDWFGTPQTQENIDIIFKNQ